VDAAPVVSRVKMNATRPGHDLLGERIGFGSGARKGSAELVTLIRVTQI